MKKALSLISLLISVNSMAIETQYCSVSVEVYPAELSAYSDLEESEIKKLGPEFFRRLEPSKVINPVTEEAFFAAEAAIIDSKGIERHGLGWNTAIKHGKALEIGKRIPIVLDCTSESFIVDVLMQNFQSDYTIVKISRENSAFEGIDSEYFIYKNELTGYVNNGTAKSILFAGDTDMDGFIHNY